MIKVNYHFYFKYLSIYFIEDDIDENKKEPGKLIFAL